MNYYSIKKMFLLIVLFKINLLAYADFISFTEFLSEDYPVSKITCLRATTTEEMDRFKDDNEFKRQVLKKLESAQLVNLHTLYLENMELTDDQLIPVFSSNQHLLRLTNLYLRKNAEVTKGLLDSIQGNETLGSVRSLPQISARWGVPSAQINLYFSESEDFPGQSHSEIVRKFREKPHFDFIISYIHPVKGTYMFPDARGIKLLDISFQ